MIASTPSPAVTSVITTGGSKDAYCPKGYNCYAVEEFLRPLEQTATLCGMSYQSPIMFYGALQLEQQGLKEEVEKYRAFLAGSES